jgi:hypothetical protein
VRAEQLVEVAHLIRRCGVPVQKEAARRIRLVEAVGDERVRERVGT